MENCRTLPFLVGTIPPSSIKVDSTTAKLQWESRSCAVSHQHTLITEPLLILVFQLEPGGKPFFLPAQTRWEGNCLRPPTHQIISGMKRMCTFEGWQEEVNFHTLSNQRIRARKTVDSWENKCLSFLDECGKLSKKERAAWQCGHTYLIRSVSGLLNQLSDAVHVVGDVAQGQQLLVDTFNLAQKIRQLVG